MEKLVSSWYNDKSLPHDYVFPPDKRPGKDHEVARCNSIPVIDLEKADYDGRNHIIQQIRDASQDFGFFQVNCRSRQSFTELTPCSFVILV